jgi:hypothetical protein
VRLVKITLFFLLSVGFCVYLDGALNVLFGFATKSTVECTVRAPLLRVLEKQKQNIVCWNRKEPKLNLFRLFFSLFHETKSFRFESVRQPEAARLLLNRLV